MPSCTSARPEALHGYPADWSRSRRTHCGWSTGSFRSLRDPSGLQPRGRGAGSSGRSRHRSTPSGRPRRLGVRYQQGPTCLVAKLGRRGAVHGLQHRGRFVPFLGSLYFSPAHEAKCSGMVARMDHYVTRSARVFLSIRHAFAPTRSQTETSAVRHSGWQRGRTTARLNQNPTMLRDRP